MHGPRCARYDTGLQAASSFETNAAGRVVSRGESGADCIYMQRYGGTEHGNFRTLRAGDHVITTVCEHNSVLRPLYALEKQGLELSVIPADVSGRIDYDQMEAAVRKNTKAFVVTHASNLTGNITDLARVCEIAEHHSLLLIVDAAQTAGILPIDVQKSGIGVLCFFRPQRTIRAAGEPAESTSVPNFRSARSKWAEAESKL